MDVEDSYEGAVRRLQRLEMAGIAIEAPPPPAGDDSAERLRELEELATLACEDNERLKAEFGAALQELDGARKDLDAAREQIGKLRGQVASLEQRLTLAQQTVASAPPPVLASAPPPVLASARQSEFPPPPQPFAPPPQPVLTSAPQSEFPPPPQPFAPAPQPFAPAPQPFAPRPSPFAPSPFATEALPDEDYGYPPKRGKGAFYFFILAAVGAAVAALAVMRPWDHPPAAALVPVELPKPAPEPVATAPRPTTTATTTTTTAPEAKPAPTIPKLATPKIRQVAAAVAAPKPHGRKAHVADRKRAKHHGAKKHGAASARETANDAGDDPLGGTSL